MYSFTPLGCSPLLSHSFVFLFLGFFLFLPGRGDGPLPRRRGRGFGEPGRRRGPRVRPVLQTRAPPGPGLGTRGSPRWGAPQGSGARASQRKRRNRLRGQIRATLGHPLHDPHPRRRFDRRYLSGLAWPTPHPRRFLAVSCCLPRPSRPSHPGLSRHAKRLPQAHAIRVRQKLRSMWNWARFSFLSVFRNPVPRRQIFFFFGGGGL
mmetsp:Transcript_23366/g.52709  ORF Transcript_23366/g.52709 Transcript_23366/m.52709 type:complete len:206 (+) Transcript_23366:484-1101(+)